MGEELPDQLTLVSSIKDCYVGIFCTNDEGNDLYGKTFQGGKKYTAQITVFLPSMYNFADDVILIIDGKTFAPEDYDSDMVEISLEIESDIPEPSLAAENSKELTISKVSSLDYEAVIFGCVIGLIALYGATRVLKRRKKKRKKDLKCDYTKCTFKYWMTHPIPKVHF